MFKSKKLYELCFRAEEGLPLPARPIICFLIKAALARTQRDSKVVLGNYVWMANHPHISLVSQDLNALKNFYGELKKRLTDMIKRLLGLKKLNLWPREPSVCEVLDLDEAISRHVYYFLNPARACLVDSIDTYSGESTWKAFLSAEPSVDTTVEVSVPWIRLPSIPVLSRANPSRVEENRIIEELQRTNTAAEKLTFYPFAWLKAFNITDREEIERIRTQIVQTVREKEAELRVQRARENKAIFGKTRLEQEAIIVTGYKPKKQERSIYFLSSVLELRQGYVRLFRYFCELCRDCYLMACRGIREVGWPPGAFVPPIPPLINPI